MKVPSIVLVLACIAQTRKKEVVNFFHSALKAGVSERNACTQPPGLLQGANMHPLSPRGPDFRLICW